MIESTHRPSQVFIDLDAIHHNVKLKVQSLEKHQCVFAVVKADGYGHGSVEISKVALKAGAKGLCVSNLDEAIELREHGIKAPILVMSYVPPAYSSIAIKHNVTLTVTSYEWMKEVSELGVKEAWCDALELHIKIDSGMGRIGLTTPEEVRKVVELLKKHSNLFTLDGIFTHFATADTKDSSYFNKQEEQFKHLLSYLKDVNVKYIHSSNSAASMFKDVSYSHIIRYGIGMYGINPSGNDLIPSETLKPALSLTTEIVHVKRVKKGDKIGYGITYEAPEDEYIATLPIGYADGIIRKFQGYQVIVDGHYAEIVGRVCMDQCMIRLPKFYPIGTTITFFGENGGVVNTVEDAADYLDTIGYEVVCGLSTRLPRVYLKQNEIHQEC